MMCACVTGAPRHTNSQIIPLKNVTSQLQLYPITRDRKTFVQAVHTKLRQTTKRTVTERALHSSRHVPVTVADTCPSQWQTRAFHEHSGRQAPFTVTDTCLSQWQTRANTCPSQWQTRATHSAWQTRANTCPSQWQTRALHSGRHVPFTVHGRHVYLRKHHRPAVPHLVGLHPHQFEVSTHRLR